MKQLIITFGFVLIANLLIAQDINIEIESVTIDNLITFIVDEVESRNETSEDNPVHLTFLLQTSLTEISTEDKVILKQAFKLISDRLSNEDYISILTYSGYSGTALARTCPKELKTIVYTLEHLKPSIKEFYKNGIEHAYNYAEKHYLENATNTIVMVRNPKALRSTEASVTSQDSTKKSNNAALITAIALIPELISVIKD